MGWVVELGALAGVSATMILFRTKTRKLLLLVASLVLLAIAWNFARGWYWRSHPESAFRSVTGRELPSGVHAVAYAHEITDNLFHPTRYWMLTGSPTGLRQVIVGTGFVESLEDARRMVPDLSRLFGVTLSSTRVVAGYELELGRDRWYCIFAGETNAFYAY